MIATTGNVVYNVADWVADLRYTDDTVANVAVEGVNYINENGVTKVSNAIVEVNSEGVTVSKVGSGFDTSITDTGLYINLYDEAVAKFDNREAYINQIKTGRITTNGLRIENKNNRTNLIFMKEV